MRFELDDELLHDVADDFRRQAVEVDDGVEPVAEFRREQALDRLFVLLVLLAAAEADALSGSIRRAGIGGHDQDDVPEIDLLAVRIGQRAVVHHLQQDVEQVRVRLLDFVEQQHAVRMLIDAVGQQAALIVADIARRRADEAETVWRSMYSDMSKRSSSMPMMFASERATSVLPTPVGPANR